jgi:serine/threonine-protein kinase
MPPVLRHTLASLGAWTVGAGIAVAVGVLALSLIDAGLAAGGSRPVPVDAPVALDPSTHPGDSASSADPASPPAGPSPSVSAPSAWAPLASPTASSSPSATPGPPHQLSSSGGTVIARCVGTSAYLVSWSPEPEYQVDDTGRGPARIAFVVFVNGLQRVTLAVRCVAGVPQRTRYDE